MKTLKIFLLSLLMVITLSTGVKAEFFKDIIVTGKGAIWTDARAYGTGTYTQASIEAALIAIGASNKATLLLSPGNWVILTALAFPANVTVSMPAGAYFSGAAVTAGTITFANKAQVVTPAMFGINTTPGVTDMSVAINASIQSTDQPIIFAGETYLINCTTTVGWPAIWGKTSFIMKSNMHLKGIAGQTIIKMKAGVSSDASPVAFNMFSTIADLDNISFDGITFDMNGQNNLQSPGRPAVYNRLESWVIATGLVTGRVDNLRVEDCIFKNGPGTNVIVIGVVASTPWATLSTNVAIKNNQFIDNGMDTDDHTTIMSNATKVRIQDNVFTSPNYAIKRNTAVQVDGSDSQVKGNYIDGYIGAFLVGESFDGGISQGIEISGNYAKVFLLGLVFSHPTDPAMLVSGMSNVLIHDNVFEIVDSASTYTSEDVGIYIKTPYSVSNIFIHDNRFFKSSGTNYTSYGILLGTTVAGQKSDNIHIYNNTFNLMTQSIKFFGGDGGHGRVYIYNNSITSSTTSIDSLAFGDALAIDGIGIYLNVKAGQVADYVRLTGNQIYNSTVAGISLSGTFTGFFYGQDNQILTSGTINYAENAVTITTRYGMFPAKSLVWDPGNLVDGAGETSGNVAVPGAKFGDFVLVSPPYTLSGITYTGWVTSPDIVQIRLQNESGGALDLVSGSWKVRVISAE